MNISKYADIKGKIERYLGQFGEIYVPDAIKIDKDELLGLDDQKEYLNSFFKALVDFSNEEKKLRENLFPIPIIFSALLVGPPGTGKTTLAKAFAKEYNIPIIVVFSNALIGSLLGESLNRVKNLLRQAERYARTDKPIILFFDEIDAISSERANKSDVGEIKRMVISFLQELDLLLEKQLPIGIIGATNHPGQLDKAVWRRFTFKIDFPAPSDEMRLELINHFLQKIGTKFEVDDSFYDKESQGKLREVSIKMTGADIERAFQIAVLQSYASRTESGNPIDFNFNDLYNAIKSLTKKSYNEDSTNDYKKEEQNNSDYQDEPGIPQVE